MLQNRGGLRKWDLRVLDFYSGAVGLGWEDTEEEEKSMEFLVGLGLLCK